MDIWVKTDDTFITLPVLPSSFEMTGSMNNTSVVIENLGEVNLKGKRGLYSMSIESFFPKTKTAGYIRYRAKEPYDYVKLFKKWYENNTTLRVVVSGTNISMPMTITQFTWGEQDATRDVYYTLEFTEYRALKKEKSKRPASYNKAKKTKGVKVVNYKWKKGDTWQSVCRKRFGKKYKYYKYNRMDNSSLINKVRLKHPTYSESKALIGSTVKLVDYDEYTDIQIEKKKLAKMQKLQQATDKAKDKMQKEAKKKRLAKKAKAKSKKK